MSLEQERLSYQKQAYYGLELVVLLTSWFWFFRLNQIFAN